MEPAHPIANLRTHVCVVLTGVGQGLEKQAVWTDAAQEFIRKLHRLGLTITIVGPKPPRKFGTKKTVRFMDRHEITGLKKLAASRSHQIELRLLNSKTQGWTRLRAEACVVWGPEGVWPKTYEGWDSPGVLSLDALERWTGEFKWVPGRDFAFIGSSNSVFRMASQLLDQGAQHCYVVEESDALKCWRAHRDRFLAKGGRVLIKHRPIKLVNTQNAGFDFYLNNDQGTLILQIDTVVFANTNDHALNSPEQWKDGLYYLHRRCFANEPGVDEEQWLEELDWREIYSRLAKQFDAIDYAENERELKIIKSDRRKMLEYRKPQAKKELAYSGKILNRDTLAMVQSSSGTPRSFGHTKPMASLECLENVPCRACADVCPEGAIEIMRITDQPALLEDKCTGCGACVAICPAGAAVMVKELPVQQKARYFLPDDGRELWKPGRAVHLLNRRGETLGTGRVVSSASYENGLHRVLEIESTHVHMWEARHFKPVATGEYAEAEPEISRVSPQLLKRGWVMLNGAKRLCPLDVPVTVALWQLGQRRFEDALFCRDRSCQLCEITIDGKPALACNTIVQEGMAIEFSKKSHSKSQPLCPCKQVSAEDYFSMVKEGASEALVREITGVGQGRCHGRWCLSSNEFCSRSDLRPVFHGFEGSPWRDLWAEDIADLGDDLDSDFGLE